MSAHKQLLAERDRLVSTMLVMREQLTRADERGAELDLVKAEREEARKQRDACAERLGEYRREVERRDELLRGADADAADALKQRDACAEEAAVLRLEVERAAQEFAHAQALAQETVKQVEAADEALRLAARDVARLRAMKAELVAALAEISEKLPSQLAARALSDKVDALLAIARLDGGGT